MRVCDRCGNELTDENEVSDLTRGAFRLCYVDYSEAELCQDCHNRYKNLMNIFMGFNTKIKCTENENVICPIKACRSRDSEEMKALDKLLDTE